MIQKRLLSFIVFSCLITMALGMFGAVAIPATALADGTGPEPGMQAPSQPDPVEEATDIETKGEVANRAPDQVFSVIDVIEMLMRTAVM